MGRVLVFVVFCFFCGCALREGEKNLEKAFKVFNRVSIGMSHEDVCWFLGTTQVEGKSSVIYSHDVGISFSGKEYQVVCYVKNSSLVRALIVKPLYEKGVRTNKFEVLVAEKGCSEREAL